MRQQINLCQDVLFEKKLPLNARLILGILGSVVAIFYCVSVLFMWQQSNREAAISSLQKEKTRLSAGLQVYRLQNPPKQKDPQVARELEQMRSELAGRKPLLDYFDRIQPGMSRGFSPVIDGLARNTYKGVWLTHIVLNSADQKILLAGSAARAELIPAYLQYLSDNQVLQGQNFASLTLERLEEKANQVNFRLESEFGDADE